MIFYFSSPIYVLTGLWFLTFFELFFVLTELEISFLLCLQVILFLKLTCTVSKVIMIRKKKGILILFLIEFLFCAL